MNPKLSRKQNELNLLENIEISLKNLNLNQSPQVVINNAVFNVKRVKDLINGIYE